MPRVKYTVDLTQNNAHLFNISLDIIQPQVDQCFFLPTWIPGSYMVREFSQHIVNIKAYGDNKELKIVKESKNKFKVLGSHAKIKLCYQIYALDSSIRSAYLDNEQGFLNGTSLFLCPFGFEKEQFAVKILPNKNQWSVATSMPAVQIDENGFGDYLAKNYEELIDYPFQISAMKRFTFIANKIPHEIVLVGDVRSFDEQRLILDLAKLCETIQEFFNNRSPFTKYLFIARFEEGAYGGLEHKDSSVLLSTPYALPNSNLKEQNEYYKKFLGLVAHEYFHAWNVKALKPKEFINFDLTQECYTNMLWAFEGVTGYYDMLFLKKAGLISNDSYLDLLEKTISKYLSTPGRLNQTLAESSFDAWIKLYRPHENSPNFSISYYQKGEIMALCLDIAIRKITKGQKSLDDVLLYLFDNYKNGISEEEWISGVKTATSYDARNFIQKYVYSLEELPIKESLQAIGVTLKLVFDDNYLEKLINIFGFKIKFDPNGRAIVTFVPINGPGAKAGVTPGDEIIGINNIKIDQDNLSDLIDSVNELSAVSMLVCRKKKIKKVNIKTGKNIAKTYKLLFKENYKKIKSCIYWK